MIDSNDVILWLLKLEDRSLSARIVNLSDNEGLTRLGITTRDDSTYVPADFWNPAVCNSACAIEIACMFYDTQYWQPLGLAEVPLPFAASLLSCAVNMGKSACIELLTESKGDFQTFLSLWATRYKHLTQVNADNERFLSGWLARAASIYPELPA